MGNCWGAKISSESPSVYTSGANSKFTSRNANELSSSSSRVSATSVPPTPRSEGEILQSSNVKSFTFNELRTSTRNFRPDSVLGEGGFGSVFKGWIDERTFAAAKPGTGIVIAVKKLNQEGYQGHREWLSHNHTPPHTAHLPVPHMPPAGPPPPQHATSSHCPLQTPLLLNFLPYSDPLYSLSRTYYYGHKLPTPRGVPYFVKSARFEEKYPFDCSQRAALEQSIEREYLELLRQSCRTKLQRRRWGWDEEMVYCNMLRKFETVAA